MALLDRIQQFFALQPWQEPELRTRDGDDSSIADLMARFNVRGTVWRPSGVREALGVPAIFRAASFIANTTGALSLRAYRNGQRLPDEDRPRLIVRPNPFTTPRDFFRDTAWSMATRGEAWWWIAARDFDDAPLSLIPVNPAEIVVSEDERDLRFPKIEWRGKIMPNRDMIQITYIREPGDLRGKGPLQMCGAAVSVAVEAQEFAANFYSDGGYPSTVIKHASYLSGELDADGTSEASRFLAQWNDKANNTARLIDQSIESVDQFEPSSQGAQMLQARDYQNGEAARMFGIPGSLLEYGVAGSSLTYQNVGQELDKCTRTCLWPNYFEPIEQAMSDLLSRSTVARFNLEGLLRADIKTRYDVHAIAIDKGIYDQAHAQEIEGLAPGDIENAPVPLSLPQAVPGSLAIQGRSQEMRDVRCPACARLVTRSDGRVEAKCRGCKTSFVSEPTLQLRNEPESVVVNMPPPAPMNLSVSIPQTEMSIATMADKVAAMASGVESVRQHVANQAIQFDERLAELMAAQMALTAQVTAPRKARRFVPERNAEGQIVGITEAA